LHAKTPRVLIVDDDINARALCSINLVLEGVEVLEAEDGHHGLARAREEQPDLVVTDIAMPGLDGFALAEALRNDTSTARIPLIFLSGELDAGNEARAHSLGALAYVTKPFDPGAFAKLVAGALDRFGPRNPNV
jgi:CheY-like chemotaxis protein